MIRLTLTVAVVAATLHAQTLVAQDSLDTRFDPTLRTSLGPVLDSARTRNVPTDPLLDKALEGMSKHATNDRIVAAVRHLSDEIFTVRTLLGDDASTPELVAGASALNAGIRPVTFTLLARSVAREQGHSLTVPLSVMSELVARGVPADTAASAMLALAKNGANDQALVAFREDVEREITAGVLPEVAVAAAGPVGEVTDAALISQRRKNPTTPTPTPRKP